MKNLFALLVVMLLAIAANAGEMPAAHAGRHARPANSAPARGQILMLAHQLGYRLPDQAAYGIWQWDKLWKQHGFTSRPR